MQNPLVFLFKKMWQYSAGNRRNLILYMAMLIGATLIMALDPLVIGMFLNSLQTDGLTKGNISNLVFILSFLLFIEIAFWALWGPGRTIEMRNAFWVRRNYKNFLLKGTMSLPMEWHTDHHSGDTIDKIEKGSSALFNFSERTFEFISGGISLIAAFGVMFFYQPLSAIVALLITLFAFSILTLFDKRLVPGYKQVNKMDNTTSAKVYDALSNVTTVIILRVEALVLKSIDLFIKKPFNRFDLNSKINEWKWFSASIFGRIAVFAVVVIYMYSSLTKGTILVGTIFILYGYANNIREVFFKFAFLYNDTVRYRASVSNSEELSKDFKPIQLLGKNHLPKTWEKLLVKNLSFSYHTKENADLHLDNISLQIKKGERIALVGESGGGKSTLLRIIRDLYHPKSLSLNLDGREIKGGFADISDSISLIPQDPEIFATTIRENITLGVEYNDEHLKIFTEMAKISDVIEGLPKKLESSVVEKGVNLSGGEKQRLALARGLLASVDKEIILLDEPTSSVDFQNELDIFKNIFSSFPEQTILCSVHRLHLLSLFDTVYYFDEGKIVASGKFEELKNTSSEFQKLWEKYIKTRDA